MRVSISAVLVNSNTMIIIKYLKVIHRSVLGNIFRENIAKMLLYSIEHIICRRLAMLKGADAYLINNRVTSVTSYCPSFLVNCNAERKVVILLSILPKL